MTKGARNIHGLAATLRRLEQEAAAGPCKLHPDRPSVGFIVGWNNHPKGVCETCAIYGENHGYTVHRVARCFCKHPERDGIAHRSHECLPIGPLGRVSPDA